MMILPLLVSLAGPAVALEADDPPPPVRVELNHEQFTRGDRARVYVETVQDGHLVVLHADPDGRVRVLFPLDPSDDDFVRGGRRFELRGRSDRDAFFVDDGDGAGTVVAVFSPDPLSYDAFVRNDHWDYRAFGGGTTELRDDPLAGLLDIARRMAGEAHFEYDAATYVVGGEVAARYGSGYYGSGYYGYGHPYRFGVGLSFGYPGYYPWGYDPFCYDPFWGWSCGSRFGGFGYSSYYYGRPYYYRPYGYSRFGGFGRGFTGGSRFVMPRDRVRITGIQPRSRVGAANPAAVPRGSRAATPRSVQPRGGSSRGPSMSPRGGSSRGPSVSRPSNGGRGRSTPSGGGSRGGASRGSGGGGRRH
jgi:uncharacterized protein DUF4384